MKRRGLILALIFVALVLGGLALFAITFNMSALETPGETEAWLALKARRWFVARGVKREPLPPAPAWSRESVESGEMNYGMSCANCHGKDGRTPSQLGLSMYPPTPGLGSPDVQAYTDAELFWVIKHGVRHSGMPGFGRIYSDDDLWRLVHYVRSLREGQM
ncbi:MAG TPA: cytochrome c [Candidatus Xenobia bacterium]|nr:cytochrome c [Candidatus Xenobia bacterium]